MKKGRPSTSVFIRGDILLEIMEDKGYTRASLAREIGSTRQAITRSINDKWMEEELLKHVCRFLDVAPSFIRGEEKHSEAVYDCNLKEVLKDAPLDDYEKIIKSHFIGYSDDPKIPIKYKYKSFPYSYERRAQLDEIEVLKDWLICCGLQKDLLYFDDSDLLYFDALLVQQTILISTEIHAKKAEKEIERINNLYGNH